MRNEVPGISTRWLPPQCCVEAKTSSRKSSNVLYQLLPLYHLTPPGLGEYTRRHFHCWIDIHLTVNGLCCQKILCNWHFGYRGFFKKSPKSRNWRWMVHCRGSSLEPVLVGLSLKSKDNSARKKYEQRVCRRLPLKKESETWVSANMDRNWDRTAGLGWDLSRRCKCWPSSRIISDDVG